MGNQCCLNRDKSSKAAPSLFQQTTNNQNKAPETVQYRPSAANPNSAPDHPYPNPAIDERIFSVKIEIRQGLKLIYTYKEEVSNLETIGALRARIQPKIGERKFAMSFFRSSRLEDYQTIEEVKLGRNDIIYCDLDWGN